jgi:hypothetical protein
MSTNIKKFEIGKTYSCRSICNYDCIFSIVVTDRSKCFVSTACGKRLKVTVRDGEETVMPQGRYSMAPVISAA